MWGSHMGMGSGWVVVMSCSLSQVVELTVAAAVDASPPQADDNGSRNLRRPTTSAAACPGPGADPIVGGRRTEGRPRRAGAGDRVRRLHRRGARPLAGR